ncbi:30S ribosomal protein S5 [Candidatus Woesearchaeota archaeon]|nr:30S ribosomal protein S5 [Candidatus Woesearchaeota archaeon]
MERRKNNNSRRPQGQRQKPGFEVSEWKPRTLLGKRVKAGEIVNIGQVLDEGKPIIEQEVVDALLPNLESDLLLIGQAKGKFGGGKRRAFRQTQKKTKEGNVLSFATFAVVGNKDGYVGIGNGKSKETIPAREKAFRKAKLNLIKVRRGCGSWECGCKSPHSIPYQVTGKCGSCEITLIPAPKGTGLCVEKECQKILRLAGIKDVWSMTRGRTVVKSNLVIACFEALKNLMTTKIQPKHIELQGAVEGAIKAAETVKPEEIEEILPQEEPKQEAKEAKKGTK